MDKEQQIEEIMLTVPQKIVAYDGNPAGQHLYGEQRQEIAEALYNAGYRKIDENFAVITKAELKEYKRQAVKELAEKLKEKCSDYLSDTNFDGKYDFDIHIGELSRMIDELLKEYER